MIDWTRHFDQIYCIHYLGQRDKLPRLKKELKRVGIADSGILSMHYTSPSPYDEIIFEKQKSKAVPTSAFVNICLEVRKCLAEAIEFGYKRILLLENDVCFLKDLDELDRLLDLTPQGYKVVQYDKFVNTRVVGDYKERCANLRINENYIVGSGGFYTSAACVGLFGDGITEMKKWMDKHIVATDIVYQEMQCLYAIAVKNLAIQIFYDNSYSIEANGLNYMHEVYENADVRYKDYAIPRGYGYGKTYTPAKKLFISVYAIAKNEERFAERWYNCFKEADEVCVLVNNSTDKTAKILRKLGAKVKVVTYKDFRFDKALNDAMKLCSPKADLLFKADIDDVVKPGWRKQIERAWELGEVKGEKPNAILFTYTVVWEDKATGRQPMIRHSIHTPKDWYWEGRVHEVLEHKYYKNFLYFPKFEVESRPEPKDHSGYLALLEQDVKEEKRLDGRTLHLLGREYMQYKRYDDAIDTLIKHLTHPGATWNSERAASMKFIANCYAHKGDVSKQEMWLWRAMLEDEKDRDAPYMLGMLLIKGKEYGLAVKVLERCLKIEKPQLDFPAFQLEAWGERPWMLLGEAYFRGGQWEKGKECLEKALGMNPHNELAKTMYNQMQTALRTRSIAPRHEVPRKRIEIPELM